MKAKGVLSLDDTLLAHYGKQFDNIAYLYDSAHKCYVWAHNLVNLHYSDDQTDYPVAFRLWEPADLDTLETGLTAAGVTIRQRLASKTASQKSGDNICWGFGGGISTSQKSKSSIKASCF